MNRWIYDKWVLARPGAAGGTRCSWRWLLLGVAVVLAATSAWGQQRHVVVIDAATGEPVERASLYAKEGGRFRAAVSDERGRATVDFDFRRLTVSHLNYETLQLRVLPDTLRLRPKYRSVAEVVVTNKEPAWIRQKLRQAVRQKEQRYFSREATEAFCYSTQSLDEHSLYRYRLTGWLRMRSSGHRLYAIRPDSSVITASDSTRLTDVANLRRMLSEDFMHELSRDFIAGHRWAVNPDYEGRSADEVELVFRSRHRTDDRGRLVIDTARCVVLQAYRLTGTETNRHERMPAVLYAMAKALTGYRIRTWTRSYHVAYGERPDGTFYPAEVRYKTYIEGNDGLQEPDTEEFASRTGGGFPNMEATLSLRAPTEAEALEAEAAAAEDWEELPASWYIRYGTEASRQREVELAGLKADFVLYE